MKRIFALLLALCLLCGCNVAARWQEQYDLGMRYLNEQNYEEAIAAFNEAIRIDPHRTEAYLGMADVLAAMGENEMARELLERYLAENGENEAIRQKLEEVKKAETPAPSPTPTAEPAVDLRAAWDGYLATSQQPEAFFLPADYDGDGTEEAFGITGNYDEDFTMYNTVTICFVSSDGTVTPVRSTERDGSPLGGYLHTRDDEPNLLETDGVKFLCWEISAGGSGSLTVLLGVRDGQAYEPSVSNQYMDFNRSNDGIITGKTHDFSNGVHEYVPHTFAFDPATGQFVEDMTQFEERPGPSGGYSCSVKDFTEDGSDRMLWFYYSTEGDQITFTLHERSVPYGYLLYETSSATITWAPGEIPFHITNPDGSEYNGTVTFYKVPGQNDALRLSFNVTDTGGWTGTVRTATNLNMGLE